MGNIPIREICSYCGEPDHHQGNCPDWVRDEVSRLSQKHKREHEARQRHETLSVPGRMSFTVLEKGSK